LIKVEERHKVLESAMDKAEGAANVLWAIVLEIA
jgi:hypothetical protein